MTTASDSSKCMFDDIYLLSQRAKFLSQRATLSTLTTGQQEVNTEETNMGCSEAFQLSSGEQRTRRQNNSSNRSVANAMLKKRSMKAMVGVM